MELIIEAVVGLCSRTAQTLSRQLTPGTEEFWLLLSPVLAYWAVACVYECLDHSHSPWVAWHRVTRKQAGRPNPLSRLEVLQRVLLQQLLQTLLAIIALLADPEQCSTNPPKGWLQSGMQFVIGMFAMDAWQYWIHRLVHTPWLYKNIHSTHHRLLIPYAMGALYNHPAEALLLDTLGAGVSMYAAGMSCRLATMFFSFSTIKTVLDHSSYVFPLNPLHNVFTNSSSYHDIHHDIRYIKKNFSQPFFTFWDVLCGTYLEPTQFHLSQAQLETATHGLKDARCAADVATGKQGVRHKTSLGLQEGDSVCVAAVGPGRPGSKGEGISHRGAAQPAGPEGHKADSSSLVSGSHYLVQR